jgi:hypothetical protein
LSQSHKKRGKQSKQDMLRETCSGHRNTHDQSRNETDDRN